MGMGDQKPKYTPSHHTSYCAVTRQYYADCAMRTCPHDGVQKKYGEGCKVSVYVCARCVHGEKHPCFAGYTCALEKQAGESNQDPPADTK